jgi:hypothetical protein
VRVDLVYSNGPDAATKLTLKPRRSWRAFFAELFGYGRFGGFGRFGRLHGVSGSGGA